jgi:putative intracellular protease/amidase
MSNVLIVLSSAHSITLANGSEHPTGFWAEEFVVAHRALTAAGHTVTVATPGGIAPVVDTLSAGTEEFDDYITVNSDVLAHPVVLSNVSGADYDAIVLPGGHAPMQDLAKDTFLGELLTEANRKGTIIAPYCHGVAALLSAKPDGKFAFAGRRLTAFTDEEERQGGLGDNTPYFLAATLADLGADVVESAPWSSHVIIDGNLISGQNPQSSEAVATALLAALAKVPA